MAAGEDQPQAVVLDAVGIGKRGRCRPRPMSAAAPASSSGVKRFWRLRPSIALNRPADTSHARGIRGHAFARPLFERRPEGVLQRFLSDVEVAQQPDQRRQHTTGLGLVDRVHRLMNLIGRLHRARSDHLRGGRRKPADGQDLKADTYGYSWHGRTRRPETDTTTNTCSMVERGWTTLDSSAPQPRESGVQRGLSASMAMTRRVWSSAASAPRRTPRSRRQRARRPRGHRDGRCA